MINGVKVLDFVPENMGKSWKCTSEQRGHINLIVVINPPFISSFDASEEESIDEGGEEERGFLFERCMELLLGGEALGAGELSCWDVAKVLCKSHSFDNVPVILANKGSIITFPS